MAAAWGRQRATAIPRVDLHALAHAASLEALEGALQRRADPKQLTPKGETLFHSLAKGNTWQREENFTPQGTVYREIELPSRIYGGIIVVLLLNGVKINQRDKYGRTPLHIAAQQGTPSFIKLLIQRGAKPKKKDKKGRTILHYAMKNKRDSILAVLANCSRIPIMLSEPDNTGTTPIGYAAMLGNDEALETILPLFKGSLEHRDRKGRSYLQLAAASPNTAKCVPLLLNAGANPLSSDEQLRTVLHTALSRNGAVDPVTINAIISSVTGNDLADLINGQDRKGLTPLHLAVRYGHADAARALLNKGGMILPDDQGLTPFHIAIYRRDIEACRTLLHHFSSSSPETVSLLVRPDSNGRSLLHWLAVYGDSKLDDLWEEDSLFEANPSIFEQPLLRDVLGISPLHLAAEKDYVHAIKMMIPKISEPHAVRDDKDRTALHVAARYGRYDATKALLKNGFPVDVLDKHGRTPLIVACKFGQYETVIELARFGPDPSIRDNTGKCALDYAASGGHSSIMAFLISRHVFDQPDCREALVKYHGENAEPLIKEMEEILKDFEDGAFSDDDSSDDDDSDDSDDSDGGGRSGSASSGNGDIHNEMSTTPRTSSSINNATRLADAEANKAAAAVAAMALSNQEPAPASALERSPSPMQSSSSSV